jgi:hypothetical protein
MVAFVTFLWLPVSFVWCYTFTRKLCDAVMEGRLAILNAACLLLVFLWSTSVIRAFTLELTRSLSSVAP